MGTKTLLVRVTWGVLAGALGLGAVIWAKSGEDAGRNQRRDALEIAKVSVPAPRNEGNAEANLPVVLQTSKPVKADDDLEFQIVSGSIWPMPDRIGKNPSSSPIRFGESSVQFHLRVTNGGKKEVQLLSGVGTPILQPVGGKELEVHFFGNDHIIVPKYLALPPGHTIIIKGTAHLYTGHKGPCLWWEDELGTNWWIDVRPGKYSLRLHYNSRRHAAGNSNIQESGAWLGDIRTAEVPIEIVELKASEPAVCNGLEAVSRADGTWKLRKAEELGWKDPVEVSALANSTWRAPPAGQQTQVCLGFRLATLDKYWVRIVPSIATVTLKSADGVEIPSRKTGANVSVIDPQLLGLRSEFRQSVATSATLFHAGKSLTLAWADAIGNVWHVENLKPGRYAVRYIIRAEHGQPSPYISYWVGELQTTTVMVDIR